MELTPDDDGVVVRGWRVESYALVNLAVLGACAATGLAIPQLTSTVILLIGWRRMAAFRAEEFDVLVGAVDWALRTPAGR